MTSRAMIPARYQAVGSHNISRMPEWDRLEPDLRGAIEVVSKVLPFRANRYVMENLIDWSRVPDDPIFQLVFPQRDMLETDQYDEVAKRLGRGDKESLARVIRRIRLQLNPHPDGQLTHNVPMLAGRALWGLQHKYRETVLFFPFQGQTCHSYCTYCFRWAQFVDMEGLKFARKDTTDLVAYLKAHPEVTDILITGGDPLVMRAPVLRKYIEPLLSPELEHVQNIRIGTKAVASWPYRFVSDADADDCLRLFEEIVASGRHLAIMGHYSHPVELESEIAREAIRRIRRTGAQIRMQAPLIKHVNDNPEAWSSLWKTGVRLGLIPYYMFVERDTGARKYFEVPLVRAFEIHRQAHMSVSGLSRTAQGPSMSAFPGKVRILGTITLRSIMDGSVLDALHAAAGRAGAIDPDEAVLLCDFIQARDPALDRTLFFAAFDPEAAWLDQLRPAFGRDRFPFEDDADRERVHPLQSLTESLLH
ncbi:MAG: lysine 2,3-aminomutase [Bradyrhizobium sp.]